MPIYSKLANLRRVRRQSAPAARWRAEFRWRKYIPASDTAWIFVESTLNVGDQSAGCGACGKNEKHREAPWTSCRPSTWAATWGRSSIWTTLWISSAPRMDIQDAIVLVVSLCSFVVTSHKLIPLELWWRAVVPGPFGWRGSEEVPGAGNWQGLWLRNHEKSMPTFLKGSSPDNLCRFLLIYIVCLDYDAWCERCQAQNYCYPPSGKKGAALFSVGHCPASILWNNTRFRTLCQWFKWY